MRIVEAYFCVDTVKWCASDGSPLLPRSMPSFGIANTLLRLHLIHSDGTVFEDLSSTTTFTATIYTSFATSGVRVVQTSEANINIPADWVETLESEGINIAQGRIAVRLNCATTEMVEQLGEKVSGLYWLSIVSYVSGIPVETFSTQVVCRNVPDASGVSPVPVTSVLKGVVNVSVGSDFVNIVADVTDCSPVCTLIAPLGDTNNIGVSNVIYSTDRLSFTVYFTAPVPTEGFQIAYLGIR